MSGAIWRVEGFDGATRLYMCDLPATHITSGSLDTLLRTLVAKHGLTDDETVACFLRGNCTAHRTDLAVAVDTSSGRPQRRCGTNPYFVATLVRAGARELQIRKPKQERNDA